MVFLIETLLDSEKIKKICAILGFGNCWAVDSIGRSGGLALCWNQTVHCKVVDSGRNYIDAHMLQNNIPIWRFTGFYGYPERARRKDSWDLIDWLSNKSSLPWVLIGNFNDMLQKGLHRHPQTFLDGFKHTIELNGLAELELMGGNYTWERSRGKPEWVRERIDRAFASSSWW